jgi:hypothetical protein
MQVKVSSQQYLAPSEEDVLNAYVMRMPDKNFSLPVSRRGEQKRNGDKKNDGDIIRLFQAPSDAFRSLTTVSVRQLVMVTSWTPLPPQQQNFNAL